MTDKMHFSTVTNDWAPCHAKVKPCRYGAGNHKTVAEVRSIKAGVQAHVNSGQNDPSSKHDFNDAKKAFSALKGEILSRHLAPANNFDEQFMASSVGKGVLGSISIPKILSSGDISVEAKQLPVEVKTSLAEAYLRMMEAQDNLAKA